LKSISPNLKKRGQGTLRFSFAATDEKEPGEPARLTKRGFDKFKQKGLF
jgi:hypothetical protein